MRFIYKINCFTLFTAASQAFMESKTIVDDLKNQLAGKENLLSSHIILRNTFSEDEITSLLRTLLLLLL